MKEMMKEMMKEDDAADLIAKSADTTLGVIGGDLWWQWRYHPFAFRECWVGVEPKVIV